MTILTVLQAAAPRIGLSVPSAVFSATSKDAIDLQEIAKDTADMIARAHPWQKFSTIKTHAGDGSTEDFNLADDYSWMPDDGDIWSTAQRRPLTKVQSQNDWLGMVLIGTSLVTNAWIIYGGQLHIRHALSASDTAKYFYQSNFSVAPATGANKAAFTLDTDSFRLDEQLLKLGVIYKWKEMKELPYAQHMDNYEDLKEKLIARDKGATAIVLGSRRMPAGVTRAYPGALPGG